jgi:hypothetical protein
VPLPQFSAAAWAPFAADDAHWLHRRDAAAMRWLVQHASGDRLVLCVPSHARHYLAQRGIRGQFAKAASIVTLGSGSAHGATFAGDVNAQLLACAMHCAAQGHAIAVTETVFPLGGWAMEVHALDLRTGEVPKDTRTLEQRATLARLVDVLYQGWSGELAKQRVPDYLEELASSGMTWSVWAGSLVALSPDHADFAKAERYLPEVWRTEIAGQKHHLWGA